MGNVAASGGYYISCAADTIVAEPTTLTGSIGIFGMFFSGEKLIEDKMGIHTDVVKTNDHSDFGGSYPLPLPVSNRALTPYERNVLQNYVNQGYETFLSRVMSGRGLTHDELHAIAQGRVWTGEDALKNRFSRCVGRIRRCDSDCGSKSRYRKIQPDGISGSKKSDRGIIRRVYDRSKSTPVERRTRHFLYDLGTDEK